MPASYDPNLWKFTDLEGEAYEELQAKRQVYWDMICPYVTRGARWKEHIDAVIPEEHFASCNAACIWWTGAMLDVRECKDGKQRVTAPGYYETIGA